MRLFHAWCAAGGVDPVHCDVQTVLLFLQSRLDEGKAANTLKVYVAAISACHSDGQLGKHPLLSRFMKGVRRLRPAKALQVPAWDLGLVLSALGKPPFEPLDAASLKHLSWKVAFLLAVTSAKRVGELHALSVSAECLQMGPSKSSVTLRPNSSFLPKVVNRPLHLSAYVPLLSVEGSGDAPHVLCPVRALDAYVERTKAIRLTDQLFVCYGHRVLGQGLSKQRLSHCLVDTIPCAYRLAGQALPPAVVAHSVWGMATSWARLKGVPLSDICASASWASPSTFTRFYRIDVVPENRLEQAVLEVASAPSETGGSSL